MTEPSLREQHTGTVADFSNSGNPVVKKPQWDKRAVVMVSDDASLSRGDRIRLTLQREHSDHYQGSRVGDGGATVSKPSYNSTPDIPIHHDGKYGESVGDTRPRKAATQSIEDRAFNPKTHGAPKLERNKPGRDRSDTD